MQSCRRRGPPLDHEPDNAFEVCCAEELCCDFLGCGEAEEGVVYWHCGDSGAVARYAVVDVAVDVLCVQGVSCEDEICVDGVSEFEGEGEEVGVEKGERGGGVVLQGGFEGSGWG